ncbi:MAG: trypsin-like peptidase domain-containing protein [Verrucomicrobiota bacterium]
MVDGRSPLRYVYLLLLAAVMFFLASYAARWFYDRGSAATLLAAPSVEAPSDLLAYERNTIEVFQKAAPAVVFVHNLQHYRSFFSWDVTEVQAGTGSGFLWDGDGHIVTNYHVVQGASRVAVTLIDGKTYRAEIVGVEPRKDLAVLKIDLRSTNVTPFSVKVADSSAVLVGQKAIAIGNPYGLDHTLTVGTVSALGRSMSSVVEGVTIRDMVQTDAPINPGNSGGPLLDSKGRLIGMNTSILRDSTGIGFAVPSNTIKRMVNQIVTFGKPIQAEIGISIFEDRVTRSIGVEGIMIREVQPNTPAEHSGLRGTTRDRFGNIVLGDIIREIDGQPIRNYDDMYNAFDEKRTGDVVVMKYLRNGEEDTVEIPVIAVD